MVTTLRDIMNNPRDKKSEFSRIGFSRIGFFRIGFSDRRSAERLILYTDFIHGINRGSPTDQHLRLSAVRAGRGGPSSLRRQLGRPLSLIREKGLPLLSFPRRKHTLPYGANYLLFNTWPFYSGQPVSSGALFHERYTKFGDPKVHLSDTKPREEKTCNENLHVTACFQRKTLQGPIRAEKNLIGPRSRRPAREKIIEHSVLPEAKKANY